MIKKKNTQKVFERRLKKTSQLTFDACNEHCCRNLAFFFLNKTIFKKTDRFILFVLYTAIHRVSEKQEMSCISIAFQVEINMELSVTESPCTIIFSGYQMNKI